MEQRTVQVSCQSTRTAVFDSRVADFEMFLTNAAVVAWIANAGMCLERARGYTVVLWAAVCTVEIAAVIRPVIIARVGFSVVVDVAVLAASFSRGLSW